MIYSNEKGDQLPGKREAPDGKCCVAGARNEKEECQIYVAECRWGLRSGRTSGAAPKKGVLYGGVYSSSRVCAGVCEGLSIVSCNKTCRIDIWSIDD
jgi:hypothetical protein